MFVDYADASTTALSNQLVPNLFESLAVFLARLPSRVPVKIRPFTFSTCVVLLKAIRILFEEPETSRSSSPTPFLRIDLGSILRTVFAIVVWVSFSTWASSSHELPIMLGCAIYGWAGLMPKGLISNMLRAMEERGIDSTGIAFRLNDKNRAYRLDERAAHFVKDNEKILSDARRSFHGIAHTRRASPGLPISSKTAHPHPFWKYFFAHNGKVKNWVEIRKLLQKHYAEELAQAEESKDEEAIKAAAWCKDWADKITTDSQVLGPYIEMRNFKSMIGSLGLVWMLRDEVYAFHFAKEAVACKILWKYTEGEDTEDHLITIVNSTQEIVEKAFEKVPGIEYHIQWVDFPEGHIFWLTEGDFIDTGKVPTGKAQFDTYSSAKVEPEVVIVDEEPSDSAESAPTTVVTT